MTAVVFAVPTAPPVPAGLAWPGVTMTWTGWDGSVWDLVDGSVSGLALQAGVRGLLSPPVDRYTSVAAGVPGSVHRGSRTLEREVFWPLKVYGDNSSQEWIAHDRAFWRTLRPEHVGVWTVTTPTGETRRLTCRFDNPGPGGLDIDPSLVGWAVYELYLVAEDPFWHGDDVVVPGGGGDDEPFIGAAGAPPFHISGGSSLGGLAIANPGDVAGWPVWEAVGPHPDLVVGVGGSLIECPPLTTGEHLVIDTSPRVRTVLVDGVDALDATGAADFAPVPAGGSQPLFASSSGSGTVSCRLQPRFYRAW